MQAGGTVNLLNIEAEAVGESRFRRVADAKRNAGHIRLAEAGEAKVSISRNTFQDPYDHLALVESGLEIRGRRSSPGLGTARRQEGEGERDKEQRNRAPRDILSNTGQVWRRGRLDGR